VIAGGVPLRARVWVTLDGTPWAIAQLEGHLLGKHLSLTGLRPSL
jgi:hypothetical protein